MIKSNSNTTFNQKADISNSKIGGKDTFNSPLSKEFATRRKVYGLGYQGLENSVLANPDSIKIRGGAGRYSTYRKLLDDPHVWSCVQSRKSGVVNSGMDLLQAAQDRLDFEFENRSATDPTDRGFAENLRQIVSQLDMYSFADNVLDAVLYGYQPIELIWGETSHGLTPRLVAKPQEWFAFKQDGEPVFGLGGMNQKALPHGKFLMPVYGGSYANPYGSAVLSKCYWPVTFKNGGLRFWATFAERYGMPLLLGKYERGSTTDEAKELANSLNGMAQDAVIIAPSDVSVQMVEPNRNGSVELYTKMIANSNTEISKAILSQTLTTEIDSGSRAAAEIHYKIRQEVVESDMRFVQKWIDELVRVIIEINETYL